MTTIMTDTTTNPEATECEGVPNNGDCPANEEMTGSGAESTAAATDAKPDFDDPFSLASLRLPTDYAAGAGVKKVITTVPVRKPGKTNFIRVRDGEGWAFSTFVLELKESGEWYMVTRNLWSSISEELIPVRFYVGITKVGSALFLLPVRLPGLDGRMNPWHESLAAAVEVAKHRWVRIIANQNLGGYDVREAEDGHPEPVWPDLGLQEIVDIAFRGKKITDLEHPVIRDLLGKV